MFLIFILKANIRREIFEYKDQDQIIIGVGITKPKPGNFMKKKKKQKKKGRLMIIFFKHVGIFSNKISYLLVFATPLQVIALGLSTEANKLTVFATDMNVSADDVRMQSITGTEDGRFFMIGDDSNVYEYIYYVSILRLDDLI